MSTHIAGRNTYLSSIVQGPLQRNAKDWASMPLQHGQDIAREEMGTSIIGKNLPAFIYHLGCYALCLNGTGTAGSRTWILTKDPGEKKREKIWQIDLSQSMGFSGP